MLHAEKTVSATAVKSKNLTEVENPVEPIVIEKETEVKVVDSSHLLEEHLFCALLGSFATFYYPPDEIQRKPVEKYIGCTQESKTSLSEKYKVPKLSSFESIPVIPSKKSEISPRMSARASTRAIRLPKRKSRKSYRLSNKFLIEENSTEGESTTQVTTDEPPKNDIFEINFDFLYNVTGADRSIMRHLKDDGLTFDFLNGNFYEGNISFVSKDGRGFYKWTDGSKYNGKFIGDMPHGEGRMEWADESKYEGCFSQGLRNGSGSYTLRLSSINQIYSGNWTDGFQMGKGTLKITEKSWYDGDFENGLYNGRGMRQYPSGGKYLGDWKNGKQNGYGIMLFPNNDMYIGEWIDGKMNGTGKYVWNTFLNTQFVYPMHNTYMGQWKNGTRNGIGSLILSTGAVISTVWVNNVKHGWGRLLCTNGTTIETDPLFVNDILVSIKEALYKDDTDEYYTDETMTVADCILEPYKNCTSPINIPPYFMNINSHLNKFFELDDWSKRMRNINWCIWSRDMPPWCDFHYIPSVEKMNEKTKNNEDITTTQSSNKGKVNEENTLQADNKNCIKYIIPKMKSISKAGHSKMLLTKSVLNTTLKNSQGRPSLPEQNINEHQLQKIYLFEKKWLRNAIIRHMPTLQKLYNRYATICCKEKPQFECGLLRVLLWKLLKDINFGETGFSIVEIDNMAVGEADPFDFVSVSEMIHYLLIISWELYTKHNKVNTNVPGMNGAGFDLFVLEKIYPLISKEETYEPLFPNCETIPLEALYRLFESLGPNLTIKSLVRRLARKVDKHYDKHFISHLAPPNEFYKHSLKGQNGILPGGEIIYKASKLPDFDYVEEEFREPPEVCKSVDLDFLGVLGVDTIITTVVKCFPHLTNDRGEVLNQNYQICFLEFLDVLTECINAYLVRMIKYTGDLYDENKIDTIDKCLDEMIREIKTEHLDAN